MTNWAAVKDNRVVSLLWTTFDEFYADSSTMLAAAVAYNLLFSLFPFALVLTSLAGYMMSSPEIENQVIASMGTLIPVARGLIVNTLESVIKVREATGLIALLLLVWSALTFFNTLRSSLNRAWGAPSGQTFVKGRLMDVSMLALAAIGLVIFTWLTTALHFMHESNMQLWIFKFTKTSLFAKVVFTLFSGMLAYAVILLLYRFVPSNQPGWRHIWLGALLAAIGFEIIRFAFVWYVKNFAQYNLVYGPISSVIALLMFIYITAWVLLFFARFSYVKMRRDAGGLLIAGTSAPAL